MASLQLHLAQRRDQRVLLQRARQHARAAEPLVDDGAQYAPLWVWMFYAALAVEGLAAADEAVRRGLERHPDFPELHHTAIACAMLRWNASFGRAARYVATPQTTAGYVGRLPVAMEALGVPLALEGASPGRSDFFQGGDGRGGVPVGAPTQQRATGLRLPSVGRATR